MKRIILYAIMTLLAAGSGLYAESYDLQAFLDRVEKYSNDLKLAGKEIDLANANKKEALATALPHLNASASYNRYLSDYYMYMDMSALTGEGEEGGLMKLRSNRDNEYAFNVSLSQTIFSLNVRNAIVAANQYRQLTDFVYQANHLEITTYARKGFFQALLLKKVWDVTDASRQNAYDNYINVKNKFDNGLASEFELLQAEVRWKDLIPQVVEARKNYNLALIALKNLAGIPQTEEIVLEGSLDQYPDKPTELEFGKILSLRPDYNALIWQERLQKTNISAARSGYFPSLSASLSYSFSSQSDEWAFDEKNNVWLVGLNLSIPIFNGGATRASVQKAKVQYEQAGIKIDQAKDDIYREIRSVRLRLDETGEQIESARGTLGTAEKAFHIAETAAENGLATQLELKDARVALDQASLNYYSAIYEYLSASFDWEKAIGGIK